MFLGWEVFFTGQQQAAVRRHERNPEIKVSLPEALLSELQTTSLQWCSDSSSSLSSLQGWPISFGVQSLLLFLAPFEIGYSEGHISSYPEEDGASKLCSLFYRLCILTVVKLQIPVCNYKLNKMTLNLDLFYIYVDVCSGGSSIQILFLTNFYLKWLLHCVYCYAPNHRTIQCVQTY